MGDLRPRGNGRRQARLWSFAECAFDEAEWSLTVDGERARVESKPLEILRALLLRPGCVVSKDELLDLIWPDVTVVEASLPTAVHKLRLALHDERRDPHMIETVPGIGYRLAVPVELVSGPAGADKSGAPDARGRRVSALGLLATIGVALAAMWVLHDRQEPRSWQAYSAVQKAQLTALRKLDLPVIERLLAAGWDPNAAYDREGDDAMMYLLNVCEWDPNHDQRQLLLVARTLLEAGSNYTRRNAFGDTAYSIAKAPRFCGPNHPVTVMLRRMCVDGDGKGGDRCMASYDLARGKHFPG